MDDTNFDTTLQKLSEQVHQFSNFGDQTKSQASWLPSVTGKKKYYYYLAVPIGFIILLYLCEPKFVVEEVSIDGDIPTKKISKKKLFLSSIVLSIILIVVMLFIDLYKK